MRRLFAFYGVALVGVALLGLSFFMGAATANAANGDSSDIVLTTDGDGDDAASATVDDEGAFTAKVTVTNNSSSPYTVSAKGSGNAATCSLHVAPSIVPAARTQTLEISTKKPCELSSTSGAVLSFEGTTQVDMPIALVAKKPPKANSIDSLLPPFLAAAILAAIPIALVRRSSRDLKYQLKDDKGEPRYGDPNDDGISEPIADSITTATPIEGFPATWTFKDSWASNLSVGTTVFLALFGSKDALDALFGKAAENALPQLVIASALAGLFVGLAPLVLKTLGNTSMPTVGGVILAAYITLIGVVGQILAIGWVFKADDLSEDNQSGFLMPWYLVQFAVQGELFGVIGVLLIGILLFYAFWTLRIQLKEAFKTPKPKNSTPRTVANELVIAATIAAASNHWDGPSTVEALAIAHAAALDFQGSQASTTEAADYLAVPPGGEKSPGDSRVRPALIL